MYKTYLLTLFTLLALYLYWLQRQTKSSHIDIR